MAVNRPPTRPQSGTVDARCGGSADQQRRVAVKRNSRTDGVAAATGAAADATRSDSGWHAKMAASNAPGGTGAPVVPRSPKSVLPYLARNRSHWQRAPIERERTERSRVAATSRFTRDAGRGRFTATRSQSDRELGARRVYRPSTEAAEATAKLSSARASTQDAEDGRRAERRSRSASPRRRRVSRSRSSGHYRRRSSGTQSDRDDSDAEGEVAPMSPTPDRESVLEQEHLADEPAPATELGVSLGMEGVATDNGEQQPPTDDALARGGQTHAELGVDSTIERDGGTGDSAVACTGATVHLTYALPLHRTDTRPRQRSLRGTIVHVE
jgi:hypothetical protein